MHIIRSYSDVRKFGPNRGIPMLHLKLGSNSQSTSDTLKQILDNFTSLEWIYIKGDNIKGLGSLLKGLMEFRINIELELVTQGPAPGWINAPNNVLVKYDPESDFHYFTLRREDHIIFHAKTEEDIKTLDTIYEDLKLTPCSKWLIVNPEIYWSAYHLTIKYQRCRMSLEEKDESVEVRDPKDIISVP